MTYTIDIESLGKIEVHENARSRRISVRIYGNGRFTASVPPGTTPKAISNFIWQNRDAILQTAEKIEKRACAPLTFSPGTEFHTRERTLVFQRVEAGSERNALITHDKMTVFYTDKTDIEAPAFQKYVRKVIDAALKNEAARYLPQRTAALAAQHGLKYDHIDLRNMTSQWGSCSTGGRICLNIQLMRLPDELIDLVILHELTHTIHFDHSKAFYADLDRFLGGRHDELSKRLKKLRSQY